jgi:hypothetical protein
MSTTIEAIAGDGDSLIPSLIKFYGVLSLKSKCKCNLALQTDISPSLALLPENEQSRFVIFPRGNP